MPAKVNDLQKMVTEIWQIYGELKEQQRIFLAKRDQVTLSSSMELSYAGM